MYIVESIVKIEDEGGQVCSISLPEWLEKAMRHAYEENAHGSVIGALHPDECMCEICDNRIEVGRNGN